MLPGKSEVELCQELRAAPNGDEFFILLVTARNDTQDLEQALEGGANDYLIKPLHPAQLNVRLSVAERRIITYGFRAALPKPYTRHELAHVLERAFEAARAG
jgi:DNA-binding response OmpR family regulator